MGFRNPITSAQAVDTGRGPSDAGVRLYQDTTVPAVPAGIAEWRTGQMDRNATVRLAGGGSGGSAFTIDGGATELTDAPQVKLNVESLAAGSYGPVMRLVAGTGGKIVTDTALADLVAKTALPLNATYFGPYSSPFGGPVYRQTATGQVVVTGLVSATALGFSAGTVIGTLPAGCRPATERYFICPGWNARPLRIDVNTSGQIIYGGPMCTDATATVGGYIGLDGIRFPAEQ